MRAIPKGMLIHTVTISRVSEKDRWGNESPGEMTTVEHVRMEPSTRVLRDKNSAEIQLSAVLFYDAKNSTPRGLDFRLDDIVTFNGQRHQVKAIESLYDNKRLHHLEMGLVALA